ncbi:unnamed protein product [Brachionus calyciflorus]|uniref:Fido domain-containing protein n=1 Tax=Brachionus calyciflorus TaxID=104777 RepID=A0A814M9Q3_9BILA|nr:unnamed protein product [Brachionus calyciflorus]
MNLNFDIPENNLWWRPNYWPYTNELIFKKIQNFRASFLKAKNNPEFQNELKLLSKFYQSNYIHECLKGERNLNDDELSITDVEIIIENQRRKSKNEIKILNMHRALLYLFPDPFSSSNEIKEFTIDMAKKLNTILGYDLWDNPGLFRTAPVSPSNEDYEYVKPHLIEEKLESLFKNTRHLFEKYSEIHERIKIGALFFTMFLDIHPFSNGNGRISRLLLSFILSNPCVVPIGLYYSHRSREIYLNCLRESRQISSSNEKSYCPLAFSALVLESILKNVELVINLLGKI